MGSAVELFEEITQCQSGNYSYSLDGKRYRYTLRPGQTTVVTDKKGVFLGTACVMFSSANCPAYDRTLAEYLLIKNDEERYLRTANLSFGRPKARQWIPRLVMMLIALAATFGLAHFVSQAFHH